MNYFEKNLEEKKYSGKLYHSCDLDGIANLIQNFQLGNSEEENNLSFSTEASKTLFGLPCVIVLKVTNQEGEYTSDDEFRTSFETWQEMSNKIEEILVNEETYKYLRADEDEKYSGEDERREWFFWNVFQNYPITETETKKEEK